MMSWWILVPLILASILLILLFFIIITKLTISISLYHGNDNDRFVIKFRAWFGLIRYTIDVPLIKLDDDGPNIVVKEETKRGSENKGKKKEATKKITPSFIFDSISDTKTFLEHVVSFHKIIRKFFKRVKIDHVNWRTLVGVGDAANTGTLIGLLWSAKSGIITVVSKLMRLQTMPSIMVTPDFQRAIIQTEFSCMIQFRVGHAILAGIKIIQFWKGGRAKFKTKPLSMFSNEEQSV